MKIKLISLFLFISTSAIAGEIGWYEIHRNSFTPVQLLNMKDFILNNSKVSQHAQRVIFMTNVSTITSGYQSRAYIISDYRDKFIKDSTTESIVVRCTPKVETLNFVKNAINDGKITKWAITTFNNKGNIYDANYALTKNKRLNWLNKYTVYPSTP